MPTMTSVDVLNFTGVASYTSKLEDYQKSTGLKDAVITGICKIGEHRAALGVMDFSFPGRLDGFGRGREADAADREGDGEGAAAHHHLHQRRGAHV